MTEKTNELIIDEDVKTDDSEINKIIIDSERELEKLLKIYQMANNHDY